MPTLDTKETTPAEGLRIPQTEALTRALGLVHRLQLHLDRGTDVHLDSFACGLPHGEWSTGPGVSFHTATLAQYDALLGALDVDWDHSGPRSSRAVVDGVLVSVFRPREVA